MMRFPDDKVDEEASMTCPACGRELKGRTIGGIVVDVCDGGCAGIWFDQFEIREFDEAHEGAGESLLDVARDASIRVDHTKRLDCPKCSDSVMMRHFWSAKQEVEVDECGVCGGFWLDSGELKRIRSLFKNDAERKEAARQYFKDVLGDELAEFKARGRGQLESARKIAWMFRFLCPSYYIGGKQDWGAF
jgi:Zn-finger nucleic acid-binding protein